MYKYDTNSRMTWRVPKNILCCFPASIRHQLRAVLALWLRIEEVTFIHGLRIYICGIQLGIGLWYPRSFWMAQLGRQEVLGVEKVVESAFHICRIGILARPRLDCRSLWLLPTRNRLKGVSWTPSSPSELILTRSWWKRIGCLEVKLRKIVIIARAGLKGLRISRRLSPTWKSTRSLVGIWKRLLEVLFSTASWLESTSATSRLWIIG